MAKGNNNQSIEDYLKSIIEHMIRDDTYHKIDEFYKEYSRNSRRVLDKKSARR